MPSLALLTALLLAPLAAMAQQVTSDTVRDRLWLFGVPADGPRLFYEGAGYRGGSRMTPAEGAFWLGVPNLMFITQPWNQSPAMSREKTLARPATIPRARLAETGPKGNSCYEVGQA